jgi:hypothetical protein
VLGPEHPNTLSTAWHLGITLCPQGKHAEAETLFRETLEVQQRVLGPEHPHTLKTAEKLEACARFARGASGSTK